MDPAAKLLPLRQLDHTLKRIIPVVQPEEPEEGSHGPEVALDTQSGNVLCCLVRVEYEHLVDDGAI